MCSHPRPGHRRRLAIRSVDVFAFNGGETVTAGPVYHQQLNRWLRARQRITLPLTLTDPVRIRGYR